MRTHIRKSVCKDGNLELVEKSVKVEQTEVVSISSSQASLGLDQTPASSLVGCSTSTKPEAEGTEWVFLTLTSASVEGISSKLKIQKGKRVKKVMRAFGKQHRIEYKNLRFLAGSCELKGDERVGDFDGSDIDVFGEIIRSPI